MSNFEQFLNSLGRILPQVRALSALGATSFLVGGCTRDLLINLSVSDFDIEVHGIDFEGLKSVLKKFGQVCCTGKSFLVIKTPDFDADWSIPRTDGSGRKPIVCADKNLDIKTASARRDLNMNAISLDLNWLALNFATVLASCQAGKPPIEVLSFNDPFNGISDIKNKVLRAVDPNFFIQDPLRFFRVMQFISRFEMTTDEKLDQICASMEIDRQNQESQNYVSAERITEELRKMILKSRRPSLGLSWIAKVGRIEEFFPELAGQIEAGQESFDKLCRAIDCAGSVKICDSLENLIFKDETEKLILTLAALLANLNQEEAQNFLSRLKFSNQINSSIEKLIKYHSRPEKMISEGVGEGLYKELADKLFPETNLRQLAMLALFIGQGNQTFSGQAFLTDQYNEFVKNAQVAGVLERPEQPVLSGTDLLGKIKPGPEMGALLKKAYKIQILQGIKSKAELLEKIKE